MGHARGFSLIETVFTTVLLVTGLLTVAHIFSYSVATNMNNRLQSDAILLLTEKLEEFKSAKLNASLWSAGGGVDPVSPVPGFFDYVAVTSDGTRTVSNTSSSNEPYLRMWQISGEVPRAVTVIVYTTRTRSKPVELIRAATLKSPTF